MWKRDIEYQVSSSLALPVDAVFGTANFNLSSSLAEAFCVCGTRRFCDDGDAHTNVLRSPEE